MLEGLDDLKNSLNDVKINEEEIATFTFNEEFLEYGLPILYNLVLISDSLSNVIQPEDKEKSGYTIQDAILFGTFERISKLLKLLYIEFTNERQESINIFNRCLIESFINLKYFLEKNNASTYKNFLKYSLVEEKKLHSRIGRKIKDASTQKQEKRILEKIEKVFTNSGFSLEDINNSSNWPSISERAKYLNSLEDLYVVFGIGNHAIHGNWPNLYYNHLTFNDGLFYVRSEWRKPDFKDLVPTVLIGGFTIIDFIKQKLNYFAESNEIGDIVLKQLKKFAVIRKHHEEFARREYSKR
jgi:hypothetical protein